MPLEDQQQDELLNSYFDGELSVEKAVELRTELNGQLGEAVVDQELASLGELRSGLKALDQASSSVEDADRFQRMQANIMARIANSQASTRPLVALDAPSHQASWGAVLVCLAAALLIAVGASFLGQAPAGSFGPSDGMLAGNDSAPVAPRPAGNEPEETAPGLDVELPGDNAGTVRYVGDAAFQIQYCFVVDAQLSKEAHDTDLLSALLAGSGIDVKQPIAASGDVYKTLQNARSLAAEANGDGSGAYLYFVHAEVEAVGNALEQVYQDFENFPSVRFDLAFDSPTNSLLKKVAAASGERFALTESIAAPLELEGGEGYRASPFGGIPEQGQLVTRKKRQQGVAAGLALEEGKVCVLMIVRPASADDE